MSIVLQAEKQRSGKKRLLVVVYILRYQSGKRRRSVGNLSVGSGARTQHKTTQLHNHTNKQRALACNVTAPFHRDILHLVSRHGNHRGLT